MLMACIGLELSIFEYDLIKPKFLGGFIYGFYI